MGAYSDECQIEWGKDITMTLPQAVNDIGRTIFVIEFFIQFRYFCLGSALKSVHILQKNALFAYLITNLRKVKIHFFVCLIEMNHMCDIMGIPASTFLTFLIWAFIMGIGLMAIKQSN